MANKARTVLLTTDYEKDIDSVPYNEYPRPQFRRDSFLCLNGKWSFRIERGGERLYDGEILVPFVPESRISGVMRDIGENDVLIYERTFTLDPDFVRSRTLLHIGACDQYAEVFVNGIMLGENVGGYLPFTVDITDAAVLGENSVKIIARDPMDTDLPYGKQTNKRGGMWYTKISGIWQTVWVESVPDKFIERLRITPDLHGINLEVIGGTEHKTLHVEGREYPFTGSTFRLDLDDPVLWTPDDPYLYEFELSCGEDTVSSYFGLRTVTIEERNGRSLICLNEEPFFFHGLLDQGYFSDGIFLPASPRGFEEDILRMKACGFNMLRKHIKLEPELFYHYCDKHGMLVFQDMINSGKYNFLIDTALPTAGLRKGITHHASLRRRAEFEKTSRGIVENLYNHPSVVYYTIFNEGWGQFDADENYTLFKASDPSRIWDTTSGWFKENLSDVESVHVYFKPIKLRPVKDRPMVLSEFGGYSCKIHDHSFNLDKTYGYRYFDDREKFEDALVRLYEDEVLPAIENGLCAAVLTQVSDVEDETNGLLTYDRRVLKVQAQRMAKTAQKLYSEFRDKFR